MKLFYDVFSRMTNQTSDVTNGKSHYSPPLSHDHRRSSVEHNPSSQQVSRPPYNMMSPPVSAYPKPPRSEPSTPKQISFPKSEDWSDQASLLDALSQFSQSIIVASTLSSRRDQANQQLIAQQKERDRHVKHRAVFGTLIEDTDAKVEILAKSCAELDKQIEQQSKERTSTTSTLASKLPQFQSASRTTTTSISSDIPSNDGKDVCRKLHKSTPGLKDFGKGLRDLEDDVHHLRQKSILQVDIDSLAYQRDLAWTITKEELENSQRPLWEKIATLGRYLARLDQVQKDLLGVTGDRQKEAQELRRLNAQQLQDASSKTNDAHVKLAEMEKTSSDLWINQSSLRDRFDHLDRVSSDDHGPKLKELKDLTSKLVADIHKIEEALATNLNNKPDPDVTKDLAALRDKMNEVITAQSCKDDCVSSDIKRHEDSTRQFAAQLGRLIDEQESFRKELAGQLQCFKDEQVRFAQQQASQLERLRDEQGELSERHSGEVERLKYEQLRLEKSLGEEKHQQSLIGHPTQPLTPPIHSMALVPQFPDAVKFTEMEGKLGVLTGLVSAIETTCAAQQQKFENLRSDHLVKAMVSHMNSIYPTHPNNITNQLAQLHQIASQQDQFIRSLCQWQQRVEGQLAQRVIDSQLFKALETRVNTVDVSNHNALQQIEALRSKTSSLHTSIQKLSNLETRLIELSNSHQQTGTRLNLTGLNLATTRDDLGAQKESDRGQPHVDALEEQNRRIAELIHRVGTIENDQKHIYNRFEDELNGTTSELAAGLSTANPAVTQILTSIQGIDTVGKSVATGSAGSPVVQSSGGGDENYCGPTVRPSRNSSVEEPLQNARKRKRTSEPLFVGNEGSDPHERIAEAE